MDRSSNGGKLSVLAANEENFLEISDKIRWEINILIQI